jgi:hypothetical protein
MLDLGTLVFEPSFWSPRFWSISVVFGTLVFKVLVFGAPILGILFYFTESFKASPPLAHDSLLRA